MEATVLIAFRTANFRAFRDAQELSLRRARGLRSGSEEGGWDRAISPVAVVYGANASGKSTLYSAIDYLQDAVRDSYRRWEVDGSTHVVPFRLDSESANQPTELEIEFRAEDGADYVYGFRASRKAIVSEWLYVYRTANRTMLFEREGGEIRFGNSFRGSRAPIIKAAENRSNSLLLSIAAQLGNETVESAFRWIARRLRTYDARNHSAEELAIMQMIEDDPEVADQLADVLGRADVGVRNLQVVERDMKPEDMERVLVAVRGLVPEVELEIDRFEEIASRFSRTLQLTHGPADNAVPFPLAWESEGTLALLSFASIALRALKSGNTVVVDEIDSSLHPLLVAELISLFSREETNPHQAQLIVTTHDATLLNSDRHGADLLQRDQVWVTEKAEDGASTLLGLSEYKTPRSSENLARGYLTGRYGGVPMLSVFDGLAAFGMQKTKDSHYASID